MAHHSNWSSYLVKEPEFRVAFVDNFGEDRSLTILDFNSSELQLISEFVNWQNYSYLNIVNVDLVQGFEVFICDNVDYPISSLIFNFEDLNQTNKDLITNLYNMLMTKN